MDQPNKKDGDVGHARTKNQLSETIDVWFGMGQSKTVGPPRLMKRVHMSATRHAWKGSFNSYLSTPAIVSSSLGRLWTVSTFKCLHYVAEVTGRPSGARLLPEDRCLGLTCERADKLGKALVELERLATPHCIHLLCRARPGRLLETFHWLEQLNWVTSHLGTCSQVLAPEFVGLDRSSMLMLRVIGYPEE